MPAVVAQGTEAAGQAVAQPLRRKFDEALPNTPTYRQMIQTRYRDFIPLILQLNRTLGHEKTVEILSAYSEGRAREGARGVAQRMGDDFAALKRFFSPSYPAAGNTLVFDIVESTDTVHELRVTECLWAQAWRDAGAGAEGFAAVCHGDYTFAKAFNPRIEMVRDKTLMQGDAYCNHRYLLKA